MTRRPLIAGNWKMHTITVEAVGLACRVAHAARGYADRDVLLAPPFTVLAAVASELIGTEILLAGQNVHWEVSGAFTGEVSPAMLRDVGAERTESCCHGLDPVGFLVAQFAGIPDIRWTTCRATGYAQDG